MISQRKLSYTKRSYQQLELKTIMRSIAELCRVEESKQHVQQAYQYIYTREESYDELLKTNEYVRSFDETEENIPADAPEPLTEVFDALEVENNHVQPNEYIRIQRLCKANEGLYSFFSTRSIYPYLGTIFTQKKSLHLIDQQIAFTFDRYGEIKEEHFPELRQIRRDILKLKQQIETVFRKTISRLSSRGVLADISESTINHIRVIGVQSGLRSQVPGRILGRSKKGLITFVEPQEIMDMDLKLTELIDDETSLIEKILKDLADYIRPSLHSLREAQDQLCYIDFIRAKALYAQDINARLPQIIDTPALKFIDAYHPLLLQDKGKEDTIPLSIQIDDNQQIVVISGPNAGGKSISLKTVGLLSLMLNKGILIPVSKGSQAYIFDTIYTDIGDEQSIANQMSTYSSHLDFMEFLISEARPDTLFLVDELGTGTDPELGGVLGASMLEELHAKQSKGVVTTHHLEVKTLNLDHPAISAAAMQINPVTFEASYELLIGEAGQSYTFEIAQKRQIPKHVIIGAKKKLPKKRTQLDKTLHKIKSQEEQTSSNLNTSKQKIYEAEKKLQNLSQKETKLIDKLYRVQSWIDSQNKEHKVLEKIAPLIQQYIKTGSKRQFIGPILKALEKDRLDHLEKLHKQQQSDTQPKKNEKPLSKQQVTQMLHSSKKNNPKAFEDKKKDELRIPEGGFKFNLGDKVKLIDGNQSGKLVSIHKSKAKINLGMFEMEVDISKLMPAHLPNTKP